MEYDVQRLYSVDIDPEKTVFSFGIPESLEGSMVHTWEEIRVMNRFGLVRRMVDAENESPYQFFSKNFDRETDLGRALIAEVKAVRQCVLNALGNGSIEDYEGGKSVHDYWRVLLKMSAEMSGCYDPEDFRLQLEPNAHGPHVKAQEVDGRLVVRMKARKLSDLPAMAVFVGAQMSD